MTQDEATFQGFWKGLHRAHTRGYGFERWRKGGRLHTSDIQLVSQKIQPDECDLLIALWFFCKHRLGQDSSFNLRQIGEGIKQEPDTYEPLRDLLDYLRWDMAHPKIYESLQHADYSGSRVQNMTLNRVTPTVGEPWKGAMAELETPELLDRTRWILWLNANHDGGRLYFPTRRVVIAPAVGAVVRWPAAFPHGIEGVAGVDPAFYLMGESTTQLGEETEEWGTRLVDPHSFEHGLPVL